MRAEKGEALPVHDLFKKKIEGYNENDIFIFALSNIT
jgi:hypothetical protein